MFSYGGELLDSSDARTATHVIAGHKEVRFIPL